MIGIDTVARPDDEGIRNDRGRNSRNTTITKATGPRPSTACSAQCRTVSVTPPLFMITVMPRAMPMIRATPSRSRAPFTNASVSSISLSRPISPMMTDIRMKSAVISGNHHHSVGIPMPMSSHGMTPYIMITKASPNTVRIDLVAGGHGDSLGLLPRSMLKCSWLASIMWCTTDVLGSRLTRSAYRITKKIPRPSPTIRMISRESETVADRDAGEPGGDSRREGVDGRAQGADPAAEQEDRGAGQGVVPGSDHHRDDEAVEGEALLGHAVRRPPEGEDDHQDRDHPPLPPLQPRHQRPDSRLDGSGGHRHAQEAADHDDEQRDVDGSEQGAVVVVADVALGVLDPVEPVDRRCQRVDQDPLRVPGDLVVGAGDRRACLVELVGARRDEPGGDRHQDDQREQDGVRRRQGEAAPALGLRARGLGSLIGSPPRVVAGGSAPRQVQVRGRSTGLSLWVP